MPSARKRRLRKLIKGALKSKDKDGVLITGDAAAQQAAIASISALPKGKVDVAGSQGHAWALLLNLQVAAGSPTTSNPDLDDAQTGEDFLPFDGREIVDTDGDGIGDNRDILLTKLSLDGIFKARIDESPFGPTGTLQTDLEAIDSQNTALDSVLLLGGEPAKTALDSLQTLFPDTYTEVAQNSLESKIQAQENSVEALKLEISAMTASPDVVIDDDPFYDDAAYTIAGGSDIAKTDAAATDVATPTTSGEVEITANKSLILQIEAL